MTINDYPPGSGIGSHIDTHSAFDDGISSLSLGSSCVMVFKNCRETASPNECKAVFLPRRSLAVMTKEARYTWSHGIPFRDYDEDENGVRFERQRRVSLTYRKARGFKCECTYQDLCETHL